MFTPESLEALPRTDVYSTETLADDMVNKHMLGASGGSICKPSNSYAVQGLTLLSNLLQSVDSYPSYHRQSCSKSLPTAAGKLSIGLAKHT